MPHIAIKQIKQIDNHCFQIAWSDGVTEIYRLSDLQKCCPCAGCVDEATGERRAAASAVSIDVKAITIQSVGRYAIKIHFTSGCSSGIYDFGLLRKGT